VGALQTDDWKGSKPMWFGKSVKLSRGVQALTNRKFDRSTVYVLLKVMAFLNMNFWTIVQHEKEHFLSVSAFSCAIYRALGEKLHADHVSFFCV
jgi:hypothetical protein